MYPKKDWKDHAVERPRTYTQVVNEDGSVSQTPAPGAVYQQGTPMNAEHFNNAEAGIADAHVFSSIFVQYWLNFRRWLDSMFVSVYAAMVRNDIAQTLETAQKVQARANIDAQEKIAASGMLKGSGTAVSAAVPGTDYGIPAVEVSGTLAAASWSGSVAPFTQAVTIAGMTAIKKAIVGLPHTATSAQYLAALDALLRVTSQGTDTITVTAEGDKPTLDLSILVEIVG